MNRPVVRLVAAWTVTHFGYRAALIALPLLVLEETGSAWALGLVAGATGVPTITAPWWTRRLQRRLTSAAALAGLLAAEGVATLVVPISGWRDGCPRRCWSDPGSRWDCSTPCRARSTRRCSPRSAINAIPSTGRPDCSPCRTPGAAGDDSRPAGHVAVDRPRRHRCHGRARGTLSLVGALLVATVRLTAHTEAEGDIPRMRDLLSRHPVIRAGWLVRGAGCAAWFAFPFGLSMLGVEQGRGVLLATVGLTAYAVGSLGARCSVSPPYDPHARRSSMPAPGWSPVRWLTMAAHPTPFVIGATAVVMGLAVPAGNAATTVLSPGRRPASSVVPP